MRITLTGVGPRDDLATITPLVLRQRNCTCGKLLGVIVDSPTLVRAVHKPGCPLLRRDNCEFRLNDRIGYAFKGTVSKLRDSGASEN